MHGGACGCEEASLCLRYDGKIAGGWHRDDVGASLVRLNGLKVASHHLSRLGGARAQD